VELLRPGRAEPRDPRRDLGQEHLARPALRPYARRGYVSHQVTDHTSILRFVEARFDLPALTHRDANAVPPLDMFDFAHPDLTVPTLPAATVGQAAADACGAKYPGK
jgi:phospholipase C